MNQEEDHRTTIESRIAQKQFFQKIMKIIFFCALLFFIASVVYAGLIQHKKTQEIDNLNTQIELSENDQLQDTDGDGLFDWQEELYGTSKKLRDTDGDGVSDTDEIKNNRDPVYFGEGIPDDAIAPQEILFKDVELEFPEATIREPLFTEEDIKKRVTTNIDVESIKQELNELGLILQDSYVNDARLPREFNDLFLGKTYNKNAIEQVLGRYKNTLQRIESYQQSQFLLERQSFVRAYTGIVHNLEVLLDTTIDDDREVFTDALKGYGNSVELLQKTIIQMNAYTKAHKITFSRSEPGYFFLFVL